jgi:hypothetical protein
LATKQWNIPLATKHWNLPSPPFFFSLKDGFELFGAFSFPKHNFQFNLENTCSRKLLEEEKK